jgi:hypothetical protein
MVTLSDAEALAIYKILHDIGRMALDPVEICVADKIATDLKLEVLV